jgi:hypothetical protein
VQAVLLVAAAILAGSVLAEASGRREGIERVAAVFRGLRPSASSGAPRLAADRGARRVFVVVTALTAARRRLLEEAGLVIELPGPDAPAPPWRRGEVVQGLATPAVERALAALPFVRAIEVPGVPWSNAGFVTSAGDAILTSDAARAVLGSDGAGIAVGVMSDGADSRAGSVASGDLPADVDIIAGLVGRGDEGTALLEIVHDVAPGARLLFAAPQTSAEMVAAIDAFAGAGARVVVDDLVFTDEPKFEDGPIALAARRFVDAGGVYVTSAGNFARTHYAGTYRPRASPTLSGFVYRGVHAFAGRDFGNSFRLPARADVIVVLQWNDPVGGAGDDFDLVLARRASGGDVVLAASTDMQAGSGNPYEALRYANGSLAIDAYIAIAEFARAKQPADLRVDLHVFSRVGIDLQHTVERDSVFGHAAVEEVLSVAAAPASAPDRLEPFSGQGPASIYFPVPAARQVPRLTAVDAVETAVGRRGVFVNPFRGTSAAAPHVAGCAALLLAAGVPSPVAAGAMQSTAIDLLATGFDPISGAGRLDCGAAGLLASGRARAPIVQRVAARFAAEGTIVVEANGDDPDGDARTGTARFLDRNGDVLASEETSVTPSGATGFTLALEARGALLAPARTVAVRARDATRITGVETTATLACPGDASLGDALCLIGDLLDVLADEGGRQGRRLSRLARQAAAATHRAGDALGRDRPRRARQALARAARRVRTIERVATGPLASSIADAAGALHAQLIALRAGVGQRGSSLGAGGAAPPDSSRPSAAKPSSGRDRISTRRFSVRPSAVSLVATGRDSPSPRTVMRPASTPSVTSAVRTAAARRSESV